MAQALTYIYAIYTAFIGLVFDTFEIATNVTVGWVIVAIIVFGLMINNILNLPKSAPSVKRGK